MADAQTNEVIDWRAVAILEGIEREAALGIALRATEKLLRVAELMDEVDRLRALLGLAPMEVEE